MEIKIIQENQNPLFNRKEIKFNVEAEVTPSEKEIIELIAQKFSSQPENISIKGIHGRFGSKTFTINANIYDSPEEKQAVEQKKKKSAEPKEGEAPTEAPAEIPAQEAPATEPVPKPVAETPAPVEKPSEEPTEQKPADAEDNNTNDEKNDLDNKNNDEPSGETN